LRNIGKLLTSPGRRHSVTVTVLSNQVSVIYLPSSLESVSHMEIDLCRLWWKGFHIDFSSTVVSNYEDFKWNM